MIEIYSLDGDTVVEKFIGENCISEMVEYLENNNSRLIRLSQDNDIDLIVRIAQELPNVVVKPQILWLDIFSNYNDTEDTIYANSSMEFKLIIIDEDDEITLVSDSEHYSYLKEAVTVVSIALENSWSGDGLKAELMQYKDKFDKEMYVLRIEDTSVGNLLYLEISNKNISPASVVNCLFSNEFYFDYFLYEIKGSDYFKYHILQNLYLSISDGKNDTIISNIDTLIEYLGKNEMKEEILGTILQILSDRQENDLYECTLDSYSLSAKIEHKDLEDFLISLLLI